MRRGLEFNTGWHRDGSYRQVVGRTETHIKWANLCSAHCEHHWQRIASWLKWVQEAESVIDGTVR